MRTDKTVSRGRDFSAVGRQCDAPVVRRSTPGPGQIRRSGRNIESGCRRSRNGRQAAQQADFGLIKRRGRDLNPRRTQEPETVFETAAFDRSATPPRVRKGSARPLRAPGYARPVPEPVNVWDFEQLAEEKLDANAHAYFTGGSGHEVTLRDNLVAFERRKLR